MPSFVCVLLTCFRASSAAPIDCSVYDQASFEHFVSHRFVSNSEEVRGIFACANLFRSFVYECPLQLLRRVFCFFDCRIVRRRFLRSSSFLKSSS